MKKRAREFIVKLFSLIIAITMSIPTNVFASSGTKRPKEMSTIIRLADSGGGEDTYIEDSTEDTYIEDVGEVYSEDIEQTQPAETTEVIEEAPQEEASTIAEEDASNYILSQKARLNDNHDGIIYDIKLAKKEKSYHDPNNKLSLSLMLNPNQDLKDIKLTKVAIDGKEEKREDKSNKIDELHTLNLTTPTFEKEITYTVEASIDKKAIDTNKLYSMDLSLDIGQFNLILQRISYKFVEYEKEDKTKELKLTHIKEAEDALRSISYKKDDGDVDKVIYTDYIISKDKGDEESRVYEKNKINYAINLENLKKEDTEISLDYYKADDKGFNMKKEFSANLPYQEKLDLDIPTSYILKLTVTSKTDKKNTKIESHKINGREVKNPRFVKEEEKSSDDDEEAAKKAEEEKKAAEEKAKAEEERKAEEAKKAEEARKAEEAKKAEEARKAQEASAEKKATEEKAKSEKEAKEAKEKEARDKLQAEEEAKGKEDLLKALREKSPTKDEENKAKTEVKEDSNLSKANAELKAALADKTKGTEDIQNLLTSLGEKYKLTREDQEKLMTANDAAIKALVEKDREDNFRPNMLRALASNSFDDKIFHLNAQMKVKATDTYPIPTGWYFDVKVGPYLYHSSSTQILNDLYYTGLGLVATAKYYEDGSDHFIRYTFIKPVSKDITLDINQNLKFDTANISSKSVDIDIKVAPKNNPVQSMKRKTVNINDPSPVESSFEVIDQGETQSGTYPYQLDWQTTSQKLKDKDGNEITKLAELSPSDLQAAYVEWDIEVSTDKLVDQNNPLTFDKLNLTVFGSANQGLQDFRFKASKDKNDLSTTDGYIVSNNMGELLSQNTSISKDSLGDKLYIKVKALIDPNQLHETYSIGLRINPDKNYIDNLLKEYQDRLDKLPTPIKWLKGAEQARRFREVPFNLVETKIPATFRGLNDMYNNERFYYDNTRTIVAKRITDNRVDWYALDLIRRGETQDEALNSPSFYINNQDRLKNDVKLTKVYFVPLKDGGYRKTYQAGDVVLSNGQYYPGTIISYEYQNEKAGRKDTYYLGADLKDKKKFNVDSSYESEGGRIDLFTEKISDQALANGYLVYTENPYPIMRINKNFDMVACFNDRLSAPVYEGKNGVFLDMHEDVSGDYLISRLNESIGNKSGNYSLKSYLTAGNTYDGVNLNHDGMSQGQAMEELMKKIYFYGEEVKKEYSKDHNNEQMHRLIESSMYQRVIHHFTDGKSLEDDYFGVPASSNVDEWKVDHTLQGIRQSYPDTGWDDSFDGKDKTRQTDKGLRKLKDNETRIKDYPPVQSTQYEMAQELYKKVIASYREGNDWNKDKADSVKLVFYSHTDEGKWQELITGRVMAPIEIDKYKKDGSKLKDAKFKFININSGESKEWTSTDGDTINKLYLKPGRYKVQEIKTPQGFEKVKDFDIIVKRTEIHPDDGPYKAKNLPKIHVNDGFKTELALGDNIPQAADGTKLVTIDEKNNIKVKVTNIEDNLGKLEFIKKNKFIKLGGAEFRLRKLNDNSVEKAKNDINSLVEADFDKNYYKTDAGVYGEYKFDQIPAGFYVLEETKVPIGYEKAPLYLIEAKEITDSNNKKKVELSFVGVTLETEKVNRYDKEVDLPIIRNKTKKTEIKFRKVRTENLDIKEEHLGLAEAKFRLMSLSLVDGDFYLKEGYTDHSKATEEGTPRVDGQQARGGGYITFTGLKAGEYLLEELQAPKGYNKTDLYGWKLIVSEVKDGENKGNLEYKLYEIPKGTNVNEVNTSSLKEVKLDDLINDKDKIKAFQIGNDARTINVPFSKYMGDIVTDKNGNSTVKSTEVKEKLTGKNGKPVSFNLYKSDFYGAIIADKDKDGNYIPLNKELIIQDENGIFHLEGLEFGGYYILRETNPPKGYTKADDITLKVEAEAIADEGKMKVIVRDPNTNAKTDIHSVFKGVVDFLEKEQLGKFSIKKVGNAIGYTENGKPIRVGLRRAYFRLYTANENYEIEYKDKDKKYPKEYIQKVTPGDPITEDDGKGGQKGKNPDKLPPNQGIVTFDQLKPGHYVLEEFRGPAGYERDPNYWYILVGTDGTVKKYRDNPATSTKPKTMDYSTQSMRFKMAGLDISEPIKFNNLMASQNPIPKEEKSFDTEKATITIGADQADTQLGTRNITVSIKPNTKQVTKKDPASIHLALMIDRSKDSSSNYNNGAHLDDNINKFLTDVRAKAEQTGAHVDVSLIQYANNNSKYRKLVLANKDLRDYDGAETYTYKMATISGQNLTQTKTAVTNYLKAFGVSDRTSSDTEGSRYLKEGLANIMSQIDFQKPYDKKVLVNFINFDAGNPQRVQGPGLKRKFEVAENTYPFKDPNGFERWVIQTDQKYASSSGNTNMTDYEEYMSGSNSDKFVINHLNLDVRTPDGTSRLAYQYAPYVGKDLLDQFMSDSYFTKPGNEVTSEESLVKNSDFKINLNDLVSSNNWTTSPATNPATVTRTNNSLEITNLSLAPNETYTITYTARLADSAADNTDIDIHKSIVFDEIPIVGGFKLRRDKEVTPPDPGTVIPTGDMTIKANFIYSNEEDGVDNSKSPPDDSPGEIKLQVNNKNLTVDSWEDVDGTNQKAPYKGIINFANLNSDKEYRLVYTRDTEIAGGWGSDTITEIPIDWTKADDNIVRVDITNGNLTQIFNHDETGFRIPLRISKVNENKAALTGSQFRARKIINGEKVKIYEKDENGKPIDTGKVDYPKYYNEKFDGVSEATGKPGDNYFRELTPGIYELTEEKTPNDSYRLPKDKDGNPMKWYFKVVIKDKKVPSDANYMDIEFNFEHTFSETDAFSEIITEEEKQALIGTTIKGFTKGDPDFARYIEEIKDDGRSDPARPDAPYKWIHDARVTNYRNKTSLSFMKKDKDTHRNIAGAEFSLRKAKLDNDGKLVFENNKPAYEPERTTGSDGSTLTSDQLDLIRVQPYDEEKKFAKAISTEKLGVEFTNIEAGTYILEEIKPADGYKPTDSFIAITFKEAEDGSWTQVVKGYEKDANGTYKQMPEPNNFISKNDEGKFISVNNDKNFIDLKFQKIEGNKDSDGNEIPVKSADFKLTQVDKDGKKLEGGYEKTIYSYANSNFEFKNLGVGRYKLEETRAITKFEKPDPWFFNVDQDEETYKLKIVFEKDFNGKLDESIGFKEDKDGKPIYDADGNLQDIKIRNYSKTKFSFQKLKNELGEDNKKLPLKDAYFRLKKVRYSMDANAKTYEYYGEDKDAVLKKYTNGKKVTEYDENGNVTKYTYNGNVINKDDKDNYKPDFITNATGKYSSLRRSQRNGSVDFQNLGEGIYELEEVGIPEGYQSDKNQSKWIFEVKKTDNGLVVDHNIETEKAYFETYDETYYDNIYSKNGFATESNIEDGDKNFSYKITNTKTTTDLKWKKIGSRNKSDVVKKYTKFVLLKTSDNPDDIPDNIPDDIDSTDEETVKNALKNAIRGQSDYPPYLVESTEGTFEIKDLSKGIYNLVETDAPEGYEKATRNIAIKVYEDEDGAIQKQFYEVDKVKNEATGETENVLIKESKDFHVLLTRNKQTEVDTDKDKDGNEVFYFMNKSKPYHFDLSKGFMENGKFNDITKGKLKVKIYADPKEDSEGNKINPDKTVYDQTIDLSDKGSYRIDLPNDIQLGKDYILEEVESPDGFAKTKYKYRLQFSYDRENSKFAAVLKAVLDENGKPLKNSSGQNITDSDQLLAGGQAINTGFPFRIVNNKTEIVFTKFGEDEKALGGLKPLENVGFYLEKQDPDDIQKENQGYYPLTKNMEMIKPKIGDDGTTSYYYVSNEIGKEVPVNNFNPEKITDPPVGIYKSGEDGKFKITGLTDGYYRVIEPEAPEYEKGKKYMKVNGPIKSFRVVQGKVRIFDKDSDGKIVEKEVNNTNIDSLGKIVNEKPGKGEFTLTKVNENGGALEGVKFTLHKTDANETQIGEQTTDEEGKIVFKDLPYGYYWLKETKTQDGYVLDTKKKLIALGGGDWKAPKEQKANVSKDIIFDGDQEELSSTEDSKRTKVVYPNKAEGMFARFKFKIDPKVTIEPGDYFTIHFSDNVDLDGILTSNADENGKIKGKQEDSKLNIIGPAGLLAEAKIGDDRRSITYTFTDYVKDYKPESMSMFLQLFPNRRKVEHTQDIRVTADIGKSKMNDYRYHYFDDIKVNYRGYQNPDVDISSYMLRLDPKEKTFTAIIYYNPWNKNLSNKNITFTTDHDIIQNSLSVKTYSKWNTGSRTDKWSNEHLPESYDVKFNSTDLKYLGNEYSYEIIFDRLGQDSGKTRKIVIPYNYLNRKGNERYTYVIEIKGKLLGDSVESLKTTSNYYNHNVFSYDGNKFYNSYTGKFETWSQFFNPGGLGDVKKEIKLVNYKNKIEYAKVDGGVVANVIDKAREDKQSLKNQGIGNPLKGAEFKLIKDGNDLADLTKTSDENGIFSWEGLAPGKYQVIESKSPDKDKYDLPKDPISTFEVDDNGNIVDIKDNKQILENYRKAEIKIRKTDQEGNPLPGAKFLLTPEKGLKDPSDPDKLFPALTKPDRDDESTATFSNLVAGKYTLTEERAPKGYTKSNQKWEIEVTKDGKVKWDNSFYLGDNTMKEAYVKNYSGDSDLDRLSTEIIGIERESRSFRQTITIKAKPSELENTKIVLESKAKGIKLNQANTVVRLVQYEKDGKTLRKKDNTTYTVDINNGANPNLTLRINPPYRGKEENKSVGSDDSTSPEENDGDIERIYKLIVDMPYGEDETLGAKITYDIGRINKESGKLEFGNEDEIKIIDKYAVKGSYFASIDKSSRLDYNLQYLDRDVNLITTDIANIKQPDIYLKKVDADNNKVLAGAEFELQKKVGDGYESIDKEGKVIASSADNADKWIATSDGKGYFDFKFIPDGEYRIFEIKAPVGYALSEKTVYKFKVDGGKIYKVDKESGVAERTELTVGTDNKPNSDSNRIEITNKKAQYPYTGGPGVWIGFTILGVLTMTTAGIYLAQKKKYQTK